MERTGEPYAEAARQVGRDQAEITRPEDLDELPGATLPAPVALMMARHFKAAALHLGAARKLATDNRAPGYNRLGDRKDGPLDQAHSKASKWIYRLGLYAERTAVASGTVAEMPNPFGNATPAGQQADQALYPGPHLWCASGPGGTLPQPGEDPEHDTADGDSDGDDTHKARRVRYLLLGPVPTTRLTYMAEGRNLVKARDVVPGTPAGAIWEAHRTLNTYACDWMDRTGDAPADLAAALEGCRQVLEEVVGIADGVLQEVERRSERGTLHGADQTQIFRARQDLDREKVWPFLLALNAARTAMDGAVAQLPKPGGVRVPDRLADTLKGRSAAQIRHELGAEVFKNRHIGKVTSPDHRRADTLARVLAWMHARGADTYDPDAHASDDPARAEG